MALIREGDYKIVPLEENPFSTLATTLLACKIPYVSSLHPWYHLLCKCMCSGMAACALLHMQQSVHNMAAVLEC